MRLGRGGYGTVVKGPLSESIIKRQRLDVAGIRELACLIGLQGSTHSVPTVLGASTRPGPMLDICMPRYDQTLLQVMRRKKKLSVGLLRRVLHDVCSALAFAHARMLIHRDVKPENVMLHRNQAILIDWGISRGCTSPAPQAYTPNQTTLWYRAPEILIGEPYNMAVDLWSLGVMTIELCLGRHVFRGSGEVDQLRQYIKLLGPPPKDVFSRWDRWCSVLGLDKASSVQEGDRTAWWTSIVKDPLLASFVDSLLRWDPRSRSSLSTLLLHPWFFSISSSHLTPTRIRPGVVQVLSIPRRFRSYIFNTILPAIESLPERDGVLWAATQLLVQCSTPSIAYARACTHIAIQVLGRQHNQVSSLHDVETVLNSELEFKLYVMWTPLHDLHARLNAEGLVWEVQPRPWWYLYARAMEDAILFHGGSSEWKQVHDAVLAVAHYVTGHCSTHPSSWSGEHCIVEALNECSKDRDSGRAWRKMHGRVAEDLAGDPLRRSRLAKALHTTLQSRPGT